MVSWVSLCSTQLTDYSNRKQAGNDRTEKVEFETEAVEVIGKVEADVVRVGFQAGEVVSGGVVEAGICLFQNDLGERFFGDDLLEAVVGVNGFIFSVVLRQDAA